MINIKKIDDKDFVFVNKPLSKKKEKEFSDFLKTLKAKKRRTKRIKMEKIMCDK